APLTIGNLGGLTDRRAPGRPSPSGRPGQADLIASRPTVPKGPVHLAADDGVSTHERQHPSAEALPPGPLQRASPICMVSRQVMAEMKVTVSSRTNDSAPRSVA